MPLTYDQLKERFESLAEKIKHQLEQEGCADINERTAIAKPQLMELQNQILKELQSEYQVSDKEAFFIVTHITEDRSSDDVFNIMKQYNLDEKAMISISQLKAYYSLSLEDAAKEAFLIEDKNKFNNSFNTRYFIAKLMSGPNSQYKSISEIANTFSKYKTITDKQIFELSCWRVGDISSGKITLDEALQNTVKYGIYGADGQDTGTKPYSFIDSVKEFFGFKSSSESIETPAQDLKAPELVDNAHNTDSNE